MPFYPGQEVIVVGLPAGAPRHAHIPEHNLMPVLREGSVFIVREVDARGVAAWSDHLAPTVRLHGIMGPIHQTPIGLWEIGYDARLFRPLDKKEEKTTTDISIFKKMLEPKKEDA